ncbi:MAG: hypothetical protein ACI4MQ_02590 [Candidatus Coproplasma sp.]
METVKAQITDFLNKCEELKSCKFIMATTKIKDLLKSIVNSPELYELFNTVANGFDYPAMKQRCFIDNGNCRVALPETVGERLAFIFCLLVEFDRNEINFNAFLQKYYPKDGSYYSSYHLFCDEVIGSLENIICDVFSKELESQEPVQICERAESVVQTAHNADNGLALILIYAEKQAVSSSNLSQEDKEAAAIILNALENAVLTYDTMLIQSLSCGYNYFVLYTNFVSNSISELIDELGNLVG